MKKLVLSFAVMMMASSAFAAKISFDVVLVGELDTRGAVTHVGIMKADDGKLLVQDKSGTEAVEVKVKSDNRAADGALVLDLGKGRSLTVTSAFNAQMKPLFFFTADSGERVELKPIVNMDAQ